MSEARSATAFKRPTELVTLKSGKEVELIKPDVTDLIMANADSGVIPQPLVDQLVAQLNQDVNGANKKLIYEAAHLPGLGKFNTLITCAALVWPTIVPPEQKPNYEAGEIWLADLSIADRGEITEWVMGRSAAAASRSPEKQTAGVGTASSRPAVRTKAKRTTRHK